MKNLILNLLTLMLLATTQIGFSQDKRPEVGNVCKVYTGDEGIRISIARVGSADKNEVLLGIMGIDHPWSGKVFKAKVNKYDGKEDYEITVDGKPYVIMTYRNYYEVYLTSYGTTKTEQYVWYNNNPYPECKPEWLLTEYLEQDKK